MSRSAIFGLVTAWFVAACADSPRLVEPHVKAASFSVTDAGVLGTFTLTPPANHVAGMPATSTGITLPSGVPVRVTVSGKMDFTPNPAWLTCFGPYPPLSLMSVGPSGFPPAADFSVQVGEGSATGIQPGAFVALGPRDFASDTAGIDLLGGGGELWVRRSGVSETCGDTPAYLVNGTQTVTVRLKTSEVTISARVTTYLTNLSFTAKQSGTPDESKIALHADVTPADLAPRVMWRIETASPAFPNAVTTNEQGQDATFTVTALTPERWPHDHDASLDLPPKEMAYRISATVQDDQGQTHQANTVTPTQDEIDTIREEYVELGVVRGVPDRGEFVQRARASAPDVPALNHGDYNYAVVSLAFESFLGFLHDAWLQQSNQWQINDIYRNPVHNRFHISGADLNSWHQYGCAADLQTFPVLGDHPTHEALREASIFWNDLSVLAHRLNFDVEPVWESGLGHVHVDIGRDCR